MSSIRVTRSKVVPALAVVVLLPILAWVGLHPWVAWPPLATFLDQHYAAGLAAVDQEQWNLAVQELTLVNQQGPRFKDVDTRLPNVIHQRSAYMDARIAAAQAARSSNLWNQALDELRKTIQIDPAYRDAQGLLSQIQKDRVAYLDGRLSAAVDARFGNRWNEAVQALVDMVAIEPTYRGAESLLATTRADRQLFLDQHVAAGQAARQAGRWNEAVSELRLAADTDAEYHDAIGLLRAATAERVAYLDSHISASNSARAANQWNDAVAEIALVAAMDTAYRDAGALLERTRADRQTYLDARFDAAAAARSAKTWNSAIDDLGKILTLEPGYRGAAELLERTRTDRLAWLEAEYSLGVRAYDARNWGEVYEHLGAVLTTEQPYKDAGDKLTQVEARLRPPVQVVSDVSTWKASATAAGEWWQQGFDDSTWARPARGDVNSGIPRLGETAASFIWAPNSGGANTSAYLRRHVALESDPYRATVQMNADDEYDLYVNGKRVGGDHSRDGWSTIETYDLKPFLHRGDNVIAVGAFNRENGYHVVFSMNVQQVAPASPALAAVLATLPRPTVPLALDDPEPPAAIAVEPATPSIPAEVLAYMSYMRPHLQMIGRSLNLLASQSERASSDPYLVLNYDWKLGTATALAFLKQDGKAIQTYEPVPAELTQLDNLMVAVGSDLVYIVDEYAAGIDNVSAPRIKNALTRMSSATDKTQRIKLQLDTLAKKYGVPLS